MSETEARELRAVLVEILDPLYAARLGTLTAPEAVAKAVARLQELDGALLGVIQQARAEREGAVA